MYEPIGVVLIQTTTAGFLLFLFSVGSPRHGMVVPTFRGGLPSSLEAMVCLLSDSNNSLDPVQIIMIFLGKS